MVLEVGLVLAVFVASQIVFDSLGGVSARSSQLPAERTPQVDERSFRGFSCPRGMQNLWVTESLEGEFQILST